MNIFFDDKDKNELGKLIHVGAGVGTEVNEYASQGFTEILLLEPIPKVFNQLERKVAKLEKLNTKCKILALNVALSGKSEKSKEDVFYITWPTRYSSFHKTDKLKALFQNLKTEQEITVDTLSFTNLIEKVTLDKDKKNVLVLQVNGAEFNVLQQANENELMLFSCIAIQQFKSNYFENAKGVSKLIDLMKSKGFQLTIENDSDVVFSHLTFRKDENVFKLKALNENNQIQATRIKDLENQLNTSNEIKTNELNKVAEQSKKQAMRIEELENQINASNEAKANDTNKVAEQSKKQAMRIEELDNLTKKNEDKLVKLSIENELITKERDSQAGHHKKNKDWAESLKLQVSKLTVDLEEKSRSAILSQKMQAKADVDLDNLRESYSQKLTSEMELLDLVKELREKLTLASKYYSVLQQKHPELLSDKAIVTAKPNNGDR